MLALERSRMLPFERCLRRKARFVGEKRKLGPLGEVRLPFRYGRVADTLRGPRMNVSVNVPDTRDEWYMTGGSVFGVDRTGTAGMRPVHGRVDEPARAVSREGVSRGVGICIVAVLCFVLGVITLMNVSAVMEEGKTYNRIQTKISEYTKENQALEQSLAEASEKINVGYEAVAMGLINPKGMDVISLTAPENATLSEDSVRALASEHLATILGE